MPFLLDAIRCEANTHLCSGTWLRSMTVPTVTLKGLRQSLHLYTPGRVDLPASLVIRSPMTPQRGQFGPFGQSNFSKCARAASSSL